MNERIVVGGERPRNEPTDIADRAGAFEPHDDRINILGVGVSVVNLDSAIKTIEHWIDAGAQKYVCVTDAHCVLEARRDERLSNVYRNAGMAMADGMPLVWLSRLLGETRTERIRGTDLMRKVAEVSSLRGYRQFYFGGAEGIAAKLKQTMVAAYPGLDVAGTLCPPFRELTREEDQSVVDAINAASPDILWVGLGAPKQELWMSNHLGRINAPVMIGVGAAFDFLTGAKPQAPRWMQQRGLEWLFRACSEPGRLGRRYARVVPSFALLAARELAYRAVHAR